VQCQKGHITKEPASWEKLERIIQREIEAIKKEGDWLINEIIEGSSDNESEEIKKRRTELTTEEGK